MSSHFEVLHSPSYWGGCYSTQAPLKCLKPILLLGFTIVLKLFILTRHIENPCSKCKCKLVLGTTKGTFLSFQMKLNRFQGRSGVVKREPWPLPSPPFIVPRSLPNHHSQYPTGASLTLNICPTLPLRW